MNPLQEYPHLFANGKFAVSYTTPKRNGMVGVKGTISGVWNDGNKNHFFVRSKNMVSVIECTLIARPISDMTDEEVLGFWNPYDGDQLISTLREQIAHLCDDGNVMTADEMLYLLSIGVYPFDQSHFETGEVININKI